MSSDSSSSDSEISGDEDLDDNVLKAFQAVKCNLTSAGVKKKENDKDFVQRSGKHEFPKGTRKKGSSSVRHKLIYQTFQKGDVYKQSEKRSADYPDTICDQNKERAPDFGRFFFDKGPAACTYENEEDIVAYDLTNIGDTANIYSEDQEYGTVNTFALTNDEVSEPDSVSLNFGIHNFSDKDSESENEMEETDPAENEPIKTEEKKERKDNGILSSQLEADIEVKDVYINLNPLRKSKSNKMISTQRRKEPEIMKKSVIKEDFERQDSLQTTHVSVRQQKKQRRLEREKTKGDKWFNMPATELTDERKYDLQVIQMRKALDPKRFYKAHDLKSTPKYFQFGQVVEDSTDFYSSRIPKKQRKSTVVEELLADAEFRKFNKRKYEEVQDAKRHGKGPYKHMKRLKKRKK